MNEDWKGEHLIRTEKRPQPPVSEKPPVKSKAETLRIVGKRRRRVREEHAMGLLNSSIARKIGERQITIRQDLTHMGLKANRVKRDLK